LRAGFPSSSKVAGGGVGESGLSEADSGSIVKIVFVPRWNGLHLGHEGRSGIFKSRRGLVTGEHRYQPGIDSWRREPLEHFLGRL